MLKPDPNVYCYYKYIWDGGWEAGEKTESGVGENNPAIGAGLRTPPSIDRWELNPKPTMPSRTHVAFP